jgi:hypothetical protein
MARRVAGMNTFGRPRSPSYFGISYSSTMWFAEAVPDELRNLAVALRGILAPTTHNDVRRRTRLQAFGSEPDQLLKTGWENEVVS